MKLAYVDTSCIVSIAFSEPGSAAVRKKLAAFDQLFSANLLEAELQSAMARESVPPDPDLVSAIRWIMPDRPLNDEITLVLNAGYVRGAGCWHLANALYLAREPAEISFLTLDATQRKVAGILGFRR